MVKKGNKKDNPKNLSRKIRRLAIVFLIVIVLFPIAFYILSQYSWFRNGALKLILSQVNNELLGEIEISDIRFSTLEGIILKDMRVLAAGDTLLYSHRVTLNADFWMLTNKKVFLNSFIIHQPRIKLIRSDKDSLWNFEKIAKPSEDTTESETPDWQLILKKIAIRNAFIEFRDLADKNVYQTPVQYNHLELDSFNLELFASILLAKNDFQIGIKKLSFIDRVSNFNLDNIRLRVNADTNQVRIHDLEILRNETKVNIALLAEKINLFGDNPEKSITNSNIRLTFDAKAFDIQTLSYFLPFPGDLAGIYDVSHSVEGNFSKLNFNDLKVKTGSSTIEIDGSLFGLDSGENFAINANIKEAFLNKDEILNNVQALKSVRLPEFKNVKLSGKYYLDLKRMTTNINLQSDPGIIKGFAEFNYAEQNPSYSCNLDVVNLDLSKILLNEEFISNINGKIIAQGKGLDENSLDILLNTQLTESLIRDNFLKSAGMKVSYREKGMIQLDSLELHLVKTYLKDEFLTEDYKSSNLTASGFLDLRNKQVPQYKLNSDFRAVDLNHILSNKDLPIFITGKLGLEGKGFDLDSLETKLMVNMQESYLNDRSLLPFMFDLEFIRYGENERRLYLNSDFADIELSGEYNYYDLVPTITEQIESVSAYFRNKFSAINPDMVSEVKDKIEMKREKYSDLNFRASAEIKDISPLARLFGNTDLFVNAEFSMSYMSFADYSKLELDTCRINSFRMISNENTNISANNIDAGGSIEFVINDSIPMLNEFSLNSKTGNNVFINQMSLQSPILDIMFDTDNAFINYNSGINDIVDINFKVSSRFHPDNIEFAFDKLNLSYLKTYSWSQLSKTFAEFTSSGIRINNCILGRDSAEIIQIKGTYSNESFENFRIEASNFPVKDVYDFLPYDQRLLIRELSGIVDTLKISVNGTLGEPKINASLSANNMSLNKVKLGNLKSELTHKDKIISGSMDLINPLESNKNKLLKISVNSLPVDLAFAEVKERYHEQAPLDIDIRAEEMPLVLVSPFLKGLEEINGKGEASVKLFGKNPAEITMTGNMSFKNASFVVQATNLRYFADGKIVLKPGVAELSPIILYNSPTDKLGGIANISGTVDLYEFNIGYLDIFVESKGLQVLSDASVKNMPTLFGKFVIASGDEPIHFFGTLNEPNLQGDVSILEADIKMPEEIIAKVSRSALRYEIKNKNTVVFNIDTTDTNNQETSITKKSESNVQQRDLADLINYNLKVKFKGSFLVTMTIAGSQLKAKIGSVDDDSPVRYVKDRENAEARVYGDIMVKEGSSLMLYKVFKTNGKIALTGTMLDPGLDLLAEYSGNSNVAGKNKSYIVRLKLTGTKNKPNMVFSYFIDGVEQSGDTTTINENSVFLLITGKTKQDLFSGGSAESDLLKESLNSLVSTETSKALTELISGTEYIQSADINLAGGDFSSARLVLRGRLFGDLSWEIGGTVADFASNNTISIDIPLASLLNTQLLNMNMQISRSSNISTTSTLDQKEWEVKLKFGGSW